MVLINYGTKGGWGGNAYLVVESLALIDAT